MVKLLDTKTCTVDAHPASYKWKANLGTAGLLLAWHAVADSINNGVSISFSSMINKRGPSFPSKIRDHRTL